MGVNHQEFIFMILQNSLFIIFFTPFLTGLLIIPFLIAFSEKTKKVVDIAEGDILKIHKKPISLLGGLGMAVPLFLGVFFFSEKNYFLKSAAIFFGFLIIFSVMFWDDVTWKHISTIKPFVKFPILIMSALIPAIILSFAGIVFNVIPFYFISILSGSVFIFTVINSVNYQDGMDGLAGGLVFISLIGFALLSLVFGNNFALIISLVSLGAVASFLCFNFPPAKIFMGDSGAYSLGFILTVLAMIFSKPYSIYSVISTVFIIGLPVFDGVFTNIRRLAAGRSMFFGDRSHFYDNLMQAGFSTKKTLAICYFLQIIFILAGVLLYK